MKLKDLAKSLNNEYSSLQKWSFKYGFKSLNNSKIIELDSQQIEILTETAKVFREHRAKGKRISFDEVKKIVLGLKDYNLETEKQPEVKEAVKDSLPETQSLMLEKITNLEVNLNQVVELSNKLSKISFDLGAISKENSYLKTITESNQEIIIKLEAEKEALKNENRILIESLNNEKQARKDLETVREAEKIKIESLNTENLNLKKDIENLKNRRFLGFKISK